MADSTKQYAWYLEGNQLAIIEKDVNFDNNVDSKEFGPGTSRQLWKSPQSTVADALEVKYVYSPTYRLNAISTSIDSNITGWGNNSGFLYIGDLVSSFTNYDTILDVDDYFVLKNAGKWNGLHKVQSFSNVGGTSNVIQTYTPIKYDTNHSADGNTFEETPTLFYDVSVLEDESFELDLPLYLQKALVYYVKAAEDAGNLEVRQYAMREFKKMVEKHENSRISGPRIIFPGAHGIR